jgi:predicted DNA-binding protein with PD1-like motif
MKYSQAQYGRIFVLRLEDGEIVHKTIENFAKKKKIYCGVVIFLGGADKGSKIVVGPKNGRTKKIFPTELVLPNVYETLGVGTIFPNSNGEPVLHMHSSFGRKKFSYTGCIRAGVKIWHVGEIIIFELKNSTAKRLKDKTTGFELLVP